MAFDLTTFLIGGGGGFLGLVVGTLQQRYSAEGKFNARVDERLRELERKVEECEKREPYMQVVTLALKMVVPEMHRLSPRNPVLQHVASALSALPADDATFEDLIDQLNAIPWGSEK